VIVTVESVIEIEFSTEKPVAANLRFGLLERELQVALFEMTVIEAMSTSQVIEKCHRKGGLDSQHGREKGKNGERRVTLGQTKESSELGERN
jgi:hypothetical protein